MVVACLFLLVLFSCGIASGCVETIVEFTMQSALLDCYSDEKETWIYDGVWTFNNDSISRLANQRVFQDGSLELYDLRHGHTGLYQCCSQDGLICSCVKNLTIKSSFTVEAELSRIAPTSASDYRLDKVYWMPDMYSVPPSFFYNGSATKIHCHFNVYLSRSHVSVKWFYWPPLSYQPISLGNNENFHVESQEYACTDPVLRTVETRCFKTSLTILRPPANGVYRCHIRLLPLSESASWSFRPVYLIPGQDTPVSIMHVPEKTTEPTGFPGEEAFFEALGHEFGYETTTDTQSDSTVTPSESWPNGYYTEVSETYDGVSRPSGSSSLKVQPTVTWEVDPSPSSVNITAEPALIMTVRYMQNVSGICLANISCLCSGISSPTKLVIYALDPAYEGQPSAEASPTEMELSRMLQVAESLNSSHVSTLQTVKDGRLVHCASDCGATYKRLTAGGCNHTWPPTLHPSCRNTHTAPKTVFLPGTKSFTVTMTLLTFAAFLAGYCACFSARRRRTPLKDAFIYFNDNYTALETGAQEGEAGRRRPDDVDRSSPIASELNYLDLSGSYPVLTRQSPNSSGAAAAASDGGGGTLPWTQLNLLFSTEQYSLLDAACRPLVSDQLADDEFAAATGGGGCRRATVESGYGLGSLNVGLEAPTFEAAFSMGETTIREPTGNPPTPLLSLNAPRPFRTSLLEETSETVPYSTEVSTFLSLPASSNAPRGSSDGGSKQGFV